MRGVRNSALALALTALLALALTACGGGNSTGSTSTASPAAAPEQSGTATGEGQGSGDASSSTEEGSAGFRTPGGDNSIQNYGEEADAAEVEAASAALGAYLQARAEDDWAKQCAHLAEATVAPLEKLAAASPQIEGKDCAAVLAALASGTPALIRRNTLDGEIASLRVEGESAFALYHGTDGTDYFVPMVMEDGEWKLGALAPSEFL